MQRTLATSPNKCEVPEGSTSGLKWTCQIDGCPDALTRVLNIPATKIDL